MRGRRPAGPEYVDKLEGSAVSKERLQVIMGILGGQVRVQEACARLGVSESRLHQRRAPALQAALHAIEPKPAGRPSQQATPQSERIGALEQALAEKELQLQQAQVREEVALILPRVLPAAPPPQPEPQKKTRRRRGRPKQRRRR